MEDNTSWLDHEVESEGFHFFFPLIYHRIAWQSSCVAGCLSFSKCAVGTHLAQLGLRLKVNLPVFVKYFVSPRTKCCTSVQGESWHW